jgi:hypothetical protein
MEVTPEQLGACGERGLKTLLERLCLFLVKLKGFMTLHDTLKILA